MQRSDLESLPNNWKPLSVDFYQRDNVLLIAKELLGKIIVTQIGNQLTAARIVETEAYNGVIDKASHAYNNKRTKRTEVMYAAGGCSYVYLCYGIHYLFNVVTNKEDIPHAVLIRAAEPLIGTTTMLARTNKSKMDVSITRGPGNVSKALGIRHQQNSLSLMSEELLIVDDGYKLKKKDIIATPRIGVDYAGEDALLPYRFFIKDNPYVSATKQVNSLK